MNLNVMNFKAIRSIRQFHQERGVQGVFKVTYLSAGSAKCVSVLTDIGIVVRSFGIDAQLLDLAHIPQGLEGFVNRRKRDRRVDLEDLPVYVLRRWVAVVYPEEIKNAQSLRRDLQTCFPKSFDDLFDISHLSVFL